MRVKPLSLTVRLWPRAAQDRRSRVQSVQGVLRTCRRGRGRSWLGASMTQRNLIHAALAKAAHVGHRFKGTPSIDSEGTDMASLWAVALLALSRRAVLAHTGVGWPHNGHTWGLGALRGVSIVAVRYWD